MQTTKRLLALFMCLAMLFTAVPVEAFATGEASSEDTVMTEPAPDASEVPSDSAEVTEAPTEVTEAPVEPTEASTEVTEAPEEVTEAPEEETEEPSEPSAEELEIMAIADGDIVKVEHNGEVTYYATLQKAFDGFAPSNNTYGGKYVVTLLGDNNGNLNKNLQYPTEVLDITLDLNGHTITGDGTTVAVVINFGSANSAGCSFTINDSVGSGMITGGKGGVKLDGKGSTLYFAGGNITGNHGASKGGGIFMGATAKLVMTGGAIYGNSVTGSSSANTGYGGGVLANYADILGGAIYGNTAYKGSHLQTGRGGGVCTEITRTSGYSTLNIADGVVFGNTAENAGDDVMAQGNGFSSAKFTLSIGTENWYIDGWNGTKAGSGGGQTDRYSAENPVAYTDGGFTNSYKITIGLKYVVPTVEEVAPEAPYYNAESEVYDSNVDGNVLTAVCSKNDEHTLSWHYHDGAVQSVSEITKNNDGAYVCTVVFGTAAYVESFNDVVGNIVGMQYGDHILADENQTTVSVELIWNEETEKWNAVNPGVINLICTYTVTYTDGVEDEVIFEDQTYTVVCDEPTPAYTAPTEPTREGYTFTGWTPEVAETVTGNVTYTATWEKKVAYVARLESSGEQFETLQAALDAAKTALEGDLDADKITLLADTTECVKLNWSRLNGSMSLTIDLAGHTVTGNGTGSVMTFGGLTSGTGKLAIVIEDSSEAQTGTITGGSATSGGAIKMDSPKGGDSLTINGGNFTGNTATSSGGALYCAAVGATVTVNGGTFTGNTAKTGGAISAYTLVINGGTFVKNSATGTDAFTGRGGAIQVWGSGAVSLDINGGTIYGNTANRYGDDIVFCAINNASAAMTLVELNGMKWYVDGYYGAQASEANLSDRFSQENAVEFTDYDFSGKGIAVALKAAEKVLPAEPELPKDNGSNVTDQLITIVCDTVDGHAAKTYGWGDPAANFVFPKDSEPFWNEEIGAWTIGVRIDSIGAYYVGLQFNKEYNGIQHETVDGLNTIDTTLVWDAENNIWQTLTGEPFVVHVTCQDVPEAPQMGFHLGKFQIKLVGNVGGEEKVWHESLHAETVTVGEVKGNRVDGFTVDVTVTLADGDAYLAAWLAKHAPDAEEGDYLYDWSKTDNTVTFTMKYTGDTTGELYDGPEYWGVEGDSVYTAYVMEGAPDAPTKFGENVTPALIRVICDSDPNHAPMDIKWQHQSTEVRTWESGVVWSEEHNAWIVPIRIDSISVYYVWLNYEKANNDIIHDMVPDMPLPEGKNYIDTYLKWDAEQDLWVTLDGNPIEIHTTCKTAPTAPAFFDIKSFQIQVYGIVDGEEKLYAIYLDPNTTTIGEVKGSREDGFTVDVTVTITEDDAYEAGWIEKRDPDSTVADREYDWSRTPEAITFTLEYTGDLTGNLYGDRSGDWVRTDNGKTYGAVGQAYLITAKPAAPEQKNVVEDLVTIICDSDPERHEPVTGKWYPQHCKTTSDMVWNDELKAWTVDIRIGSLYIMYVNQLEDANGGTIHELVDDITTVYSTLKWDATQGLWVPVEPIELHTTCRTAPVAPAYKQLSSYQVKVYGDVNGEEKAYTTGIPEGGYTLSEVYGSREEGFFVDVTVNLSEGDIYQSTWIEKRNPGFFYNYDWTKTEKTVTFTLRYNGSLTGTLYGDRHASNTNYDWVLDTTGKTYGVITEAYLKQVTCNVSLVIYRNGNTTTPYKTISLGQLNKGEVLDLTALNIADYYSSARGFEFEGWFNDGKWNQYKAGQEVTGLEEITINGWTNIICMVTDYQAVVVKAVIGDDKANAETIFSGKALTGTELISWLNENVEVPEKAGYSVDMWYNWDWYGHKVGENATVNGWTNVYVVYTANAYTLTLNPDGGKVDPATITVTYDAPIGELPVPTKTNCIFAGWFDENGNEVTAETIYTVAGDSTVTAKWIKYPGSSSSNVTNELFTIQCTVKHEHSWLCNWFGSHVKLITGSVHYNEELGRWEAQCKIGSSMMSQINSTQPKKNYFGGITHHYDETDYVFDLYYDPNFTGLNSQKKEVTGMWLPVEEYVVPVYCYTAPSMPNVAKITSTMLWMRDAGNKLTSHSQKFTGKTLIDGTFTVGEMYTNNGKFYVDLTITDLAPYIKALGDKTGKSYVLPEWEKHLTLEDCKFTLVYTGSTTDYKQDGTGWSIDASSWNNNSEKLNGKSLWLTEQFTVTYTDGVEGKVFADQVYTVNAYTENGATKNAVTDFSATATPVFEVPARKGYTFAGWTPEWSETVTGDVTYVATWTINTYNITVEANEGGTVEVQSTADFNEVVKIAITPDTGYRIVSAKLVYVSDGTPVTANLMNADRFRMPAADVTVIVEFEQIIYNITVQAGEHGTVEVQSTAVFGEIVPLNMIPDTGYSVASAKLVYEGKHGTVTTTVQPDSVRFRMPAADVTLIVEFVANEYTVTFNPNGGAAIDPIKVTFDAKYGRLPSSALTGFSGGDSNWYLVDENGNVTDVKITRFSVVSTARDHELFVVRKILNPAVKITLTVPGGLSDGYKYYDGNPRVLTATVTNANEAELVYSYQWYKDDVAIEGATEAVLTLPGNVSDSGTYKVVVTATLKDGSTVVVTNESASGEKTQKVQIMRATNTLRLNYNYGETPETHDSYFGGAVATIRGDAGERTGYIFAGWNTAADGSGTMYQVGDSVDFPGDNGNGGVVLELFAQWKGITYTIKYNGGEGSEYTGSELNSGANWMLIKNGYTYDAPVTLHNGEGFSRTGYKLVGWTIGGETYELGQTVEKNFTKVQSGTVQAYAIWEPITYTIKYNGGEGSEYTGSEPNSGANWMLIKNGYTYDAPVTLHNGEGFSRTGYKLVGWTIGGVTYELGQTVEKNFTKVQSGTVQAYAVWEGNSYTLILDANGGAFVMPLAEDSDAVTTLEIPVTYGEPIGELPTPAREGYTFAGWFDAEGNEVTPETVYSVLGDLSVTAKWTPNTYEVTLDPNNGKLEDTTIEVTYGEPIGELPTPTRDGYTFAGWVDAEGNKVTADTIYDVADDITLIASWNVYKPADPSSPATGDGMIMFFMSTMLLSAAALLFLADRKRRMA